MTPILHICGIKWQQKITDTEVLQQLVQHSRH